ncbi:hypothetical protein AB1484_29345 [Parafrankia sp. FMc6]|uniref:hypothetical protein n=1 Tax=Parafrankia soli TaxID=2599596 RepID=UPI0034D4BE5F
MRLSRSGEIIKVSRDADLYMEWVHTADGPGRIGTRAEILAILPAHFHDECPSCQCNSAEARMARADETGSDFRGDHATVWDDNGLVVEGRWWLPRENFEAFARATLVRDGVAIRAQFTEPDN